MYITPTKNEGILISGKYWFYINLKQKHNFFGRLFSFKCCRYGQIKPDGYIDIEGLLDNKKDNNNKNKVNCIPKHIWVILKKMIIIIMMI